MNFQALKQQMLEDGSQANIITAIQMLLNNDKPVMYTAFAKTVRWLDQQIFLSFPVGSIISSLLNRR
jgi:hypothetical protein